MAEKAAPKVFISYSWGSEEHQQKVLEIATRLMQNGVQVVIDKWNLRPGNDLLAFMETSVNDPTITHVLVLCDAAYQKKADERRQGSGVSTETRLLGPDLFKSPTTQEKIVPVVLEKDANNHACVPAWITGVLAIHLTPGFEEGFSMLLRHLFNEPLHVPPPLGPRPAFPRANGVVGNNAPTASDPMSQLEIARERVFYQCSVRDLHGVSLAMTEYLEIVAQAVASARTCPDTHRPTALDIRAMIDAHLPLRTGLRDVLTKWCRTVPSDATLPNAARFFESLLRACEHPVTKGGASWSDSEFEAPSFLALELFLVFCVQCISEQRVSALTSVLDDHYLVQTARQEEGNDRTFAAFAPHLPMLQKSDPKRISVVADLLKSRCASDGEFEELKQAEFLLFLRGAFRPPRYWMQTTAWISRYHPPFELFAGARTTWRFKVLSALLDVKDLDHLGSRFDAAFPTEREQFLQSGNHDQVSIARLMNLHVLLPKRLGAGRE